MNTTDEHKYWEITFYRVTTTLSHRESEAAAFRPAWFSAGVLAGGFLEHRRHLEASLGAGSVPL